jgi:hypothetical protein
MSVTVTMFEEKETQLHKVKFEKNKVNLEKL